MRVLGTALAILIAVLLESMLSLLFPEKARWFDPFLLLVIYCGLIRGETHGMLAGGAAGWVQDVFYGGSVLGLSGLTKVIVGFVVGATSTRFLLAGPVPRLIVVFTATIADTLLLERLAALFEISIPSLGFSDLLLRGAVNSAVGVVLFGVIDRRLRSDGRA